MSLRVLVVATLVLSLAAPASAKPAQPPIAVGTEVWLGLPSDGDVALSRLAGLQCKAATKLVYNADGTVAGSVTCGSATIKAKRLTLETQRERFDRTAQTALAELPRPMTDARVPSGPVTIYEIGVNDPLVARSRELVGSFCSVTRPLVLGAGGYYDGQLTCGSRRFTFAEIKVVAGEVELNPLMMHLLNDNRPGDAGNGGSNLGR